ncbi:MAG: T9SS type A sorting domain-containing protein [Aureispira sp.]|nr:T9SS type A sorting domain-containing protein [Aureispira sp.]
MKILTSLLVNCLLAIYIILPTSLSAQSLQTTIDTSCNLTIQVVDSNGIALNNGGAYIITVGSLTDSNLVQASTTIDVSSLSNGSYLVSVCQVNSTCYTDSVIISCGQGTSGSNNYQLTYNLNNSSNCSTCNGQATFQGIADPNSNNQAPAPYTFSWSDGNTNSNRTNLCSNTIYTVVVTDGAQNAYTQTIMVGCNNLGGASCVSAFDLNLDINGLATITAQDLSTIPLGTPISGGSGYIIGPTGTISSSYTFDCQDIGTNLMTLITTDSTASTDSCSVWVTITDTNNVCGGYGNNTGNYIVMQSSSSNATNCNGACDGAYSFGYLVDTTTNQQPLAPLTFVWNDGDTNSTRANLCPFYQYTLNVYDANQNHYSIPVSVACDSTSGNSPCIDSSLINPNINCATTYQPVCGCNQVTYPNACIAQSNGVSTWTTGVCSSLQVTIQSSPATCDTSGTTCNGFAAATASGGGGVYAYNWSNGSNAAVIQGLCPGVYTVTVSSSGTAGAAIKTVTIGLNGCVWPGDTDDNTVANNWDLLPIALAYGQQGFPRSSTGTTWAGVSAQDWNVVGALAGLPDYKHIDCDGNGLIDLNDANAIVQNYGQSYVRSTSSATGQLPIYVNSATASPKDKVALPINLGTVNSLATDVYGVAFTINYDPDLVEYGSVDADFMTSWLGNDLMDVRYDFSQQGKLEVAVARKDRINISGYGQIGTLYFTIIEDILRSSSPGPQTMVISIDNIRLINKNNNEIGTNSISSVVTISPVATAVDKKALRNNEIQVFPNPAKTHIQIQSTDLIETVQIYTTTGQLVHTQLDNFKQPIEIQQLPRGMYILSVKTANQVYNKRIQIIR